jgi:hypothetical protein
MGLYLRFLRACVATPRKSEIPLSLASLPVSPPTFLSK